MAEGGNGGAAKRQFLHMTIHEAWGLSKEQEPVWEESFTEGYVRVEVRGGSKVQKLTTFAQKVENYAMHWRQDIRVELTEQSKELRIMLCKERTRDPSVRKNTSVVAACGIFIKDILEAVPIDKAFELFKPGDAETSLGGYIRVTLKLGPGVPSIPPIHEDQLPEPAEGLRSVDPDEEASREVAESSSSGGQGGGGGGRRVFRIVRNLLVLAGIAATVVILKAKKGANE